jgi:hypothetical protein
MFQSRVEKLGCSLRIQRLEQISPEEIREAFVQLVQQYLREEQG